MKEKYPVLIYKDEKFEDEARKGLKQTFDALVNLIEIWNSLEVGPCPDFLYLAQNASQVYTNAFHARVESPDHIGTLQISREAFLNIVEVPIPNNLFVAAREVQKSPFYGYSDVWSLVDGEIIEDEAGREAVIHSRNIYAQDARQAELAKSIVEYVRLSNFIIQEFKELQWRGIPVPPFTLTGVYLRTINELKLEVEQLRYVLTYGFG